MKTPVELIYDKYEEFRSCKTAKEHGDKFLAWFLTYKEQNKENEKQTIINTVMNVGFDNDLDRELSRELKGTFTPEVYVAKMEELSERWFNERFK
jgi:hypothetical protein